MQAIKNLKAAGNKWNSTSTESDPEKKFREQSKCKAEVKVVWTPHLFTSKITTAFSNSIGENHPFIIISAA